MWKYPRDHVFKGEVIFGTVDYNKWFVNQYIWKQIREQQKKEREEYNLKKWGQKTAPDWRDYFRTVPFIGYFFDDLQKILKKKAARNKKARAARRLARWRAKRYAFLYAIWPYEDLQAALADGWYKHKPVASNYYHALITQIHKEDPSSRYFLQAEDFLRIREVLHNISLYPGYYSALPGHTDIGGWVAHLRVRNRDHPGPDRVDWELNFVYKNLYLLFRLWRSKNISNYQKFILG